MRKYHTKRTNMLFWSENYELDALESLPEARRSEACGDGKTDTKESKMDDESIDMWVIQVKSSILSEMCVGRQLIVMSAYCLSMFFGWWDVSSSGRSNELTSMTVNQMPNNAIVSLPLLNN